MSDPSSPAVRFEVLGPLRAWRGDFPIDLGPVQQRVVLAVLLLQQNRPIGREQIFTAVWGDAEPRYAANLLHRNISGLRNALELSRYPPAESGELTWTDAGYVLTVPAGGLDLTAFDREVDRARKARAAGDSALAADVLHAALGLWRGPLCDGLTSPFLDAQRDRLEERRISITEDRIELDLATGDRDDVVSELRQLVTDHPFRERLHGLLMLGLYRSGRRADALAAFQQARGILSEELGIDPSAALQRLHQQILTADPALAAAAEHRVPVDGGSAVGKQLPLPAQLPHSMPGFSGRDAEIGWLNGLLPANGDDPGGTIVITAIAGTAGVGKTALAVHWAHQIRHRFPDGQLYVNLRGFDPAGPAMEPTEAIRAFLDAFAVAPDRIPVDLDAQAALYRSLLAGRRVLIVLDNARDADQVRPLLPGTPSCLVVATSRNQLLGLVATAGASPLGIDLLPADQARSLLAGRLGAHRVAAEPAAVEQIILSCAGLPLALSIVSARAAANPQWLLAELAEELRETRGGLSALHGGDQSTDLRAVFSWSYHALTAPAARLFRLLGLHAGPDIGAPAAASLAGVPLTLVRTLLAELVGAHLLTDRNRGRFTFHDLLRAYARELTDAHDSAWVRRSAVHRVLDHYLCSAYRADQLLYPNRHDTITLAPAGPLVIPEEPADHRLALTWFDTEYPVLLAALRQAASEGFDVHTWQLAWALASFFDRRGHWHDAVAAAGTALEAADRLGDLHAQAVSHGCLALANIRLRRYEEGHDHQWRALELHTELGNLIGQAHSHRMIALILDQQGGYRDALLHSQQALELFRTAGHQTGQAAALNAVGWFHIQLGDYEKGLIHCQQALALQTGTGDQVGRAQTLDSIASACHHLGRYQEAVAHYVQAADLSHELGIRDNEASHLTDLGDAHLANGQPAAAAIAWRRALAILDDLGLPQAVQVREKLDQLAAAAGVAKRREGMGEEQSQLPQGTASAS
jgi:DNA-binding SARP family transcriptional activator/tetratricopeptide (TPR) repeat protein